MDLKCIYRVISVHGHVATCIRAAKGVVLSEACLLTDKVKCTGGTD
jgi:hypothetical protein